MCNYYLFHFTCCFNILDFVKGDVELGINKNMHLVSDEEFYSSKATVSLLHEVETLNVLNGVIYYVHSLCTDGSYKNVPIAFKEVKN